MLQGVVRKGEWTLQEVVRKGEWGTEQGRRSKVKQLYRAAQTAASSGGQRDSQESDKKPDSERASTRSARELGVEKRRSQ